MEANKSKKNQEEADSEGKDIEEQKYEILLPYNLEVVAVLRKIEQYIRTRYRDRKNSMDLKSLEPPRDIEIIIDIEETDGKNDHCFRELLKKIYEYSLIKKIAAEDKNDECLDLRIVILILARILSYDRKELWTDIYDNVKLEKSPIIEQPFYTFKYYNPSKAILVIKDYIVVPGDFVATYFGYDTGIEGLNLLMNGGFLLPPDRSVYISVSGEAGIGKTALVVRLLTAFFQNYTFKNVPPPDEKDKILEKSDAEQLDIHYILMEQRRENIIRLIKECRLIDTSNSNVKSKLGEKKEDSLDENDILKIIDFGDGKTDIFSPMALIEKVETIENSRVGKEKKRKVIVIDSVNAIQEMDINRTEWRELFQGIKSITRDRNTIVFFIMEKNPDEPDFVIEYLSDVVIKLYRDYKEEAFYRVFELVESRFQKTITGKHIFYITKPDSGFIRVYPSTTAMGELLPHRKRVKPAERDDRGNRKEVGIKIEGIINFFKYSRLYQTKMEPFFLKNSISMFIGDRGAHKSAFAKKFALSAFRDERWETAANYIVEIDYRERESNKPLDELLLIGFWNARPEEKSISLLLYFSENYDEDPEHDIIWETYFGKVIIPGCKAKGNNYIGHISHIVCLYEVKDYNEDVYIYQLDELIRTIESCKAGEDIPETYDDFINRKNISRIARKIKEDDGKKDKNGKEKHEETPINFNPFNTVYSENFIKNLKGEFDWKEFVRSVRYFINQEIHIMNFQEDEIRAVKIKKLLKKLKEQENVASVCEKYGLCKHLEELEKNPILDYYDKIIDKGKYVGKISPKELDLLKSRLKEIYSQAKELSKKKKKKYREELRDIALDKPETLVREVSRGMNCAVNRLLGAMKDEKNKKEGGFGNSSGIKEAFDLIEERVHQIDFLRRMLIFQASEFPGSSDAVEYLEKFYDHEGETLFNMKLLKTYKIISVGDNKFNQDAFTYENIDKVKVSRIVLDDAENLDNVYKSLTPQKYISTLAHLCLAKEITLGIVNTRSKDETSPVDTVCSAVSDNAFQFDKYFLKGEMFTTFSIIRSATSFHNNMMYYLSKRDDGLLQLNNTFALLANVEIQSPEPIEIRLFLPDLSNEFSKSMYRILLNRDTIEFNLNNEERGVDFAKRINYASEFEVVNPNGLKTIYNPQEQFPSIYKEWHDFLKDMITYSLAHPKVEVCTANDPFTDISIILDDESAKDAVSILCLPGYLMDLYEKNLASISDYVHFRGTEDHLPVWVPLEDKGKWITFAVDNDQAEKEKAENKGKKVKLGNEFYYLQKAPIRMPDEPREVEEETEIPLKHRWIVPEILFNPAIARHEDTNRVIIKEYKKDPYMDIKGYPYYIDPRVNLVFSTDDGKGNGNTKNLEPDYFVHNDAHDFVALFFELWFEIALKENIKCKGDHENRTCKQSCNFCFFEQAKEAENNKIIRQFIEDLVEKFIKHVKRSVVFNRDGLAANIIRLYSGNFRCKKEIVLREWYSSAQQKLKVLEPLLINQENRVYVRLDIPRYFLYTTWYLAIPVNSPRKETASEIIIKMTEPHDLAHHQISGIGLQLDERFYDTNMDKFYPQYKYSEVRDAMKNLIEYDEKCPSVGIPIASNHCYFENLTLLGGFLGDFYRYYKNSISMVKGFPGNIDDKTIDDVNKEDEENITKLTDKLIVFSKNFKNWQRDDKKRCESCYMTYLSCQYKKKKKKINKSEGVSPPQKKSEGCE